MNSQWPKSVTDFENFLRAIGLSLKLREEQAAFGNKIVQYANASIAVRVVSDRGLCFVEMEDLAGQPNQWYDTAILRDLLFGPGDDVVPLPAQIEFVETNWQEIVNRFDAAQRKDTHTKLDLLQKERVKRRFPGLHVQNGMI